MNKDLQALLETLPPDSRPVIEQLWAKLPSDVRHETEITLSGVTKLLKQNPGSFLELLKLFQRQAEPALASASRVAVVGPVNVGKSTLYNALVTRPEDRAKASAVPGTTKANQTASLGLFELVDTPGADHGAVDLGANEKATAFQAANAADFLVIVFDASGSVTASDRELYLELKALNKPHLIVLNKIDLVKAADRAAVREAAARVLDLGPEAIVPVSASHAQNIDTLVLEITAAEPNLLGRVGQVMPDLRRRLAWQVIRRAAVASAVVALTPIPIFDLIPLALIQGSLVLTISRIYAQDMGFKRAIELLSSLGAGWLARTLFQELSKIGGLPGWVVSASIACSATIAIGFTALTWFETGNRPSKEEVKGFAQKAQEHVLEVLKKMGGARPDKKGLSQELGDQLPDMFETDKSKA